MAERARTTLPFDAADALDTPEARIELLNDALASSDPQVIAAAVGLIVRAQGVTETARAAGVSREAIYKATGPTGNPTLSTLLALLKTAGIRLSAEAA
jgi:probable addiction module antidote protein